MYEIRCFDSNGNTIDYLTQWDLNQTLYIENWDFKLSPIFHFCNKKTKKALVVTGEVLDDNSVKVAVPNVLLEESCPIIIYVFLYDDNDVSGKTLHTIKLPVRAKKKPLDYEYEDNVEKITVSYLDARITNMIKALSDDTSASALSLEVQDVRVGYDGTVYSTAGEAVRQQVAAIPNQAVLSGNKIQFFKCVNNTSVLLFDLDVATLLESGLSLENLKLSAEKLQNSLILYMSDGKNEKSIELPMEVDSALSLSSTNPVQNKIVAERINYVIEELENIKENGIGGDTGVTVRLTNQNGTSTLVGSQGNAISLMFTFTSTDNDLPTGNANCKITVNKIQKVNMSIPQGLTSIDVAPYLNVGNNTVIVTCTDIYGKSRSLSYDITVVKLSIESTFNAAVTYDNDIVFKYTPYGSVEKTIHFVVDGTEIGTVVTSLSGKQMSRTIPKMSHGTHLFEVYSTATLNDTILTSPKLMYDIMCTENGDTTSMISSVYIDTDIMQGERVSIPYIVFDPTKLACDVTLTIFTKESGIEIIYNQQSIVVDRSQQFWNTRKYPIGTVYFRIEYESISKTHTIEVTESKLSIEAETTDLELLLSSEGRSNNESNPAQWSYGDVQTTFDNMNWNTTGWVSDDNGDTCLRLNGDATAEISFKPFAEDIRVYGKTIELDFVIKDVNNREAIPISCIDNGIGFEVKADTAYICSEQSRVFCNYKEEDRVRISFVIQSKDEYRILAIYLNGVMSDAIQYPTNDNFQQINPVTLKIGSPYCGIDIYNIRSYSTALTDSSVTTNFIADMTDIVRKTEVYENNDIYDEFGNISFAKAREKNSIMVLVGDLPTYKGDKKTIAVKYYDVEDSNLDFEENAVKVDIQGTSSQFYVRKNWKLKFQNEHYIDIDQLPAKVICIKVDYAEATGTHNTQCANFAHKLYSEPFPAQLDNPKCRSTIYGKPILLFHQEAEGTEPIFYGKANYNYDKSAESVFGFTSDYDVECWEFKNNTSDACNFWSEIKDNWSEDFEARYPDEHGDISRFKKMHDWVVSTNQNKATNLKLESEYTDIDGKVYTDDTAEYRLAKFKTEFETHFDIHYSLIYYVITFFFLMVDQRAKNMFLTYWAETDKWQPWLYDNDTMACINNEGGLVFDYYHTDDDQLDGANVYNGQNSTLWVNFKQAFPDLIQSTYQDLRSNSVLNYDEIIEQFITKGSDKWSESVYNEDGDFKYISMLRSNNDATNLPQIRGTGEEHFRYFVANRFSFCDSRWYAGEYPEDTAVIRIYTPTDTDGNPRTDLVIPASADITVTPYSHFYAGVRYKANGSLMQKRLSANEVYTFKAPDETFNDTETAIYGASQLSSLGDLAPLYLGYIDVGSATKLTELKIGDGTDGYQNTNLYHLAVGANRLLKKINIQNCIGFNQALILSGCPNIEEVYAKGSSITGIELPESGYLKILELPSTLTNLTLKNQLYINTLTIDGYDRLKTIVIENSSIDSLGLLDNAINAERVRFTNVDWHYEDASILFELIERNIAGIDENGINTDTMWIDGKCHIDTLTGEEYKRIKELYPYLEVTYTTLTSQLIYMSEDGSTELYRETIYNGGDGSYAGEIPIKESTAQYDFTYNGWSLKIGEDADSDSLKAVEADRIVYAAFSKIIRSYTVRFLNYDGTELPNSSQTVEYGSDATYTGSTPTNNSTGNTADFQFIGWKPEPTNIQGNTDCYAQYYDTREITDDWVTIAKNCLNNAAIQYYQIGNYKNVYTGSVELPVKMDICKALSYHDEIHVLGGTNLKQHYKWNETDGWVEVSTLPYIYQLSRLIVYHDEIHMLGGQYIGKTKHYKWNETDGWVEASTLPYEFNDGYVIVYHDEIHILSGTTSLSKHYKWNETDGWVEVSTLPCEYTYGGAVTYSDEIHMLGGTTSLSKHYKWNETDGWVEVSKLPFVFIQGCIETYDNEIHVLCTNNSHCAWNGTEWVTLAKKTCGVQWRRASFAVHNDILYILGSLENPTQFCCYDKQDNKWNPVGYSEVIPVEVAAHNHDELADGVNKWEKVSSTCEAGMGGQSGALINLSEELHAIGAKSHYKWNGTEWDKICDIPFTRYYSPVAVLNDTIYSFGTNKNTDENYSVYHKFNGTEWMEDGTLPHNGAPTQVCVMGEELYACWAGKYFCKYNGVSWEDLTLPPNSSPCEMTAYNNQIHLIYGQTAPNVIHYQYDITNDTWTEVSRPAYRGHMFVWRNKMYMYASTGALYMYNDSNLEWILYQEANPFLNIYYYRGSNRIIVFDNEIYIGNNYDVYKLTTPSWENFETLSNNICCKDNGLMHIRENDLYVLSGDTLHKWDGEEWSIVTNTPASGNWIACVYNSEIYAYKYTNDSNDEYFRKLYKYDWTEWNKVCEIPINGAGATLVEYDGCLHIMGGRYVYSRASHYKWDGEQWTQDIDLLSDVDICSSIVYNNQIHLFGINTHHVFNGTEWSESDESIFNNSSAFVSSPSCSTVYNDKLYIVFDEGIYMYDGTEWSEVKNPGYDVMGAGIVSFRGHLHLIGGYNNTLKNHYIFKNPRATLTFIAKNLLEDQRAFQAPINYNDYTKNDWINSSLRMYLNNEFYNSTLSTLRDVVSPVLKLSNNIYEKGNSDNTKISCSKDIIWIPSYGELGATSGKTGYFGLGDSYSIFTDNDSRIRNGRTYWTRNLADMQNQYLVTGYGQLDNTTILKTTEESVLIGFCI